MLARYDVVGPRYTSYPTVPVWRDDFDADDHVLALQRAATHPEAPLSVYMHVPFCEKLCHYCGCNVIVAKNRAKADPYLDAMRTEIELVARHLGGRRQVSQVHWGGGTPTFLDIARIEQLWGHLRAHFDLTEDAEVSVEINPVTTSLAQLEALRRLGFNRISLGVQDLDPRVQEAIGRHQTVEQTVEALEFSRGLGFKSVNFDLIYGLPHQDIHTWAETLDGVIQLQPDRIAVYSFAWLPQLRPHQARIDGDALPTGRAKLDLLRQAWKAFATAGYVPIGMDHFARPDDELAQAQVQGRLWRNFQGYTVQSAQDSIAFGVSAISDVGGAYAQNVRTLPKYYEAIGQGRLPTVRGMHLSPEDERRRTLITQLMCNLNVSLDEGERRHFANALAALKPLVADGLVEPTAAGLRVTDLGRIFLRNVAMPFDEYLPGSQHRFSRTV
ncbi:MAG: oxygen-independent coproporphyrinogen III oxidase [Myxococcales bacterium]|nr:oxygen-independent coproporphyrinogen III oxidase [Myxococcales bacterium]